MSPELPTRQQTPQQVRAFFDAHRTVRQYQTSPDGRPIPLPADHLDAVLHAAQRAPTDATAQLYSIIHLQNPDLRREVAALTSNPHLATASEVFVLCADARRVKKLLEVAGYAPGRWPAIAVHFGIGDAVLAGQNLLTAAEMLGYQGCWVGGVLNNLGGICTLLKLPPDVLPFAALTVGQSAEPTPLRPRLPRAMVVHTDEYREASAAELLAGIAQMNPIAERPGRPGDWARLLNLYFGAGKGMEGREGHLVEVLERQGMLAGREVGSGKW